MWEMRMAWNGSCAASSDGEAEQRSYRLDKSRYERGTGY